MAWRTDRDFKEHMLSLDTSLLLSPFHIMQISNAFKHVKKENNFKVTHARVMDLVPDIPSDHIISMYKVSFYRRFITDKIMFKRGITYK